ncbi:SPFH domain-containing protein [Streptomyces sp. S063]|uniref:SPFH domain-containing protein n=1 Tax=Streptomyces sp. S063 TaxID=2005885 RepID=UPI001EFF53D3|nr:SPFH domain-containing protein [Streptomyces sp. S063]
MTNDDQTPHSPDNLDGQLPPSLFAPPGRGAPPPLFGPIAEKTPQRAPEPAPAPPEAERVPEPPEKGGAGSAPPPLFRPVGDGTPPPEAERVPEPPERGGAGSAPPPLFRPVADRTLPPEPEPAWGPEQKPGRGPEGHPGRVPGGGKVAPSGGGKHPPAPPRTAAPEPSEPSESLEPPESSKPSESSESLDVSLHPGPARDRPAPASLAPKGPPADRPAPAPARPAAEGARPAPLDGNLHLKPVRRLRTEPSAEWTPHPSYGAEPESPKRQAGGTSAKGAGPGPDTELDLVLDLAPGDRAASATFSVPAPAAAAPATATTTASANPGRRHSVIANETTASIPVHLLFRDDQKPADGAAALPGPGAVVHQPAGDRAPATRRPPVPRSPQTRVRPSTRPAPVADPRLAERPGPALSGYAALLAGAAGTAGALAVLWWRGALPAGWQSAVGLTPRPDLGIGIGAWAALALLATAVLLAFGGLGRGRVGYAWVLTLFGDYRGSVRRTGLVWVSPLLLRRRVDVRLRHWRSEPLPAVDANGTALRVVVLVVWRIKDTVRAVLGIEDHEAYLSAQVEAAMARVLSQLPADAFHEDAPTLRDAEAVGDALTRMLKADCEPVGVEVYSAQPTGIEYAPEVAAAMQRRRIAAIDSRHRDSVLTSVVDAVDDTVNRLTTRGIVELDDYERKALVKDLTVAFYTGRSGGGDGA